MLSQKRATMSLTQKQIPIVVKYLQKVVDLHCNDFKIVSLYALKGSLGVRNIPTATVWNRIE